MSIRIKPWCRWKVIRGSPQGHPWVPAIWTAKWGSPHKSGTSVGPGVFLGHAWVPVTILMISFSTSGPGRDVWVPAQISQCVGPHRISMKVRSQQIAFFANFFFKKDVNENSELDFTKLTLKYHYHEKKRNQISRTPITSIRKKWHLLPVQMNLRLFSTTSTI